MNNNSFYTAALKIFSQLGQSIEEDGRSIKNHVPLHEIPKEIK
jgi:hypothetical protein